MTTATNTTANNVTIDVQATEVHVITLDQTMAKVRKAVADKHAGIGSVEREYAIKMNDFYVDTGIAWFTLSNAQMKLNNEGLALAKEKKAFYAALQAKGHKNPATVWARITQQYAVEDAQARALFGFEPVQKAPEGHINDEENEASEKVQQRSTRSPEVRNLEDLIALFKFNARQENLSDKLNQVQTHIVSALTAMGIDVGSIER